MHVHVQALSLFLDRWDNCVTRLVALRTFVAFSESNLNINLSIVKHKALKVIVQFLKQVRLCAVLCDASPLGA